MGKIDFSVSVFRPLAVSVNQRFYGLYLNLTGSASAAGAGAFSEGCAEGLNNQSNNTSNAKQAATSRRMMVNLRILFLRLARMDLGWGTEGTGEKRIVDRG